jgi:hypothetical protein
MVIPTWLLEVNLESALNARDFRAILNLGPSLFEKRLKLGEIPAPDFLAHAHATDDHFGFYAGNKNRPREWYVKTVLAYLKTLP